MPKMDVGDITMYYEVFGEGEPLVLIAGFAADHLTWAEVIEPLQKQFKVIVFDNRGAGQTTVPDGSYSISQMAKDVSGLCEALDIQQAHFVGNSMGGFILQQLAHDFPSLIKSAVIANSAMQTNCVFNIYLDAQLKLLQAGSPLPEIIQASCCWTMSYAYLAQPGKIGELVKLTLEAPHPFTLEGYAGQMAALNAFDSSAWVGKLNMPVLVLAGAQDIIFSTQMAEALADKIPSAKYHCFADSAHLPMIEEPEAFVEVIKRFF